ncbi:MAG: carbohydrate ABC transporter permease [Rhodospirillales bacterium]|nr:carbohydrate ABC transporter permease [Rhodospirillales bacterium]MDE0379541.1 carbohydrate ABC transporter permease [Rhodospirillales bacterium]
MTRHRFRSLWYGPLLLVIASWLFPVAWTAITSFKPEGGLIGLKPVFAFPPTLDNYIELFAEQGYGPLMLNSLLIAGGATVVSILLGSLAAYALARSRLRGREQIGLWILSLRMLPPIAIVVPFYLILNRSGLLDSYAGLLLVYLSFSLPFAIWMLLGFFSEVPRSIEEAASADGAGPLKILFLFIVPMCRGGIAVTAMFTFVFAWNEFLFAFLLTKDTWVTLPVRLGSTITPFQTDWGSLTAGAIVSFSPLIIVVFLLQREMVRGVSLGAVR